PGRSAILGLLAAALGIVRSDETALQQLAASVCVAVKQRSPGTLLRDYHTTQVLPTRRGQRLQMRRDELAGTNQQLQTILSSRDYRCDGLWHVAIWQTERSSVGLTKLADALEKPRFHLYLGRKSCPLAAPLAPVRVEADTLRQALDQPFTPLA